MGSWYLARGLVVVVKTDMRQLIAKIANHLVRRETLDGYEQPELIDIIFLKTKAYQPQEPWPDMDGISSVLDFGGGCGLHYKQANSPTIRWAIVETPAMAAKASELTTDHLRFFTNIADAAKWLGKIDIMHSNSALQYAKDPLATLKELCGLRADVMLWKRLFLSHKSTKETQISRLIDNGPGRISGTRNKIVTYDRIAISEPDFIACHEGYRLENHSSDSFRFVISEPASLR